VRGARLRTVTLLASFLVGGLPLAPPAAQAAFPGINGKIAFDTDRDAGNIDVYMMQADGSGPTRLTTDPSFDADPAWSPDGTRIAFRSDRDGNPEIYVMNADGSGQTNLTNEGSEDQEPAWSPDGNKITFASDRDGDSEIFVMNADGSSPVQLTDNILFDDAHPAWSPDGSKIAFDSDRDGNLEIYVMNAADGSGPTNLTDDPNHDFEPNWSPDGTKIAFTTERDGNDEVYVMSATDGSGQANLTNDPEDDSSPTWSPDGTRISFATNRLGTDEVFVMAAADGSGQTNLTNNLPASDSNPDWQRMFTKEVTLKAKPKKVEEGEKTRLKAKVSPCEGHEGDVVEFYRKKKRIATKKSNAECVAKAKVKVKKTTKFTAVSPEQDADHLAGTSKPVKVKAVEG
jgi:Tol biopolymer transport system component